MAALLKSLRNELRRHLLSDAAAFVLCAALMLVGGAPARATPSNKAASARHYDRFLSKDLNRCTTCHLPSAVQEPESLAEFPHNRFGDRLRAIGEELSTAGKAKDLSTRLALVAGEDADADGVDNETEILGGQNPGDEKMTSTPAQMVEARKSREEFQQFLAAYRWRPFDRVQRPAIPA